MTTPAALSRGRPHNALIQTHFKVLGQLQNKSGRAWVQCSYCGEKPNSIGAKIENRDNKPAKHLTDTDECPGAPPEARQAARMFLAAKNIISVNGVDILAPPVIDLARDDNENLVDSAGAVIATVPRKKKRDGKLDGYIDCALTPAQKNLADVSLFRWVVHANLALSTPENSYFQKFINVIRPSYEAPSRYVLSHRIMDAELARVQMEDMARLKSSSLLTLLMDGWEDLVKRELYGTVAAQVDKFPVVMSLDDLTGVRATAENVVDAALRALTKMELADGRSFIALTTDNPSTMKSFRKKMEERYHWLLTFACFLHGIGNIIGDICSYPAMKKNISRTTRVVSFFNTSHYWGGQLDDEAKKHSVTHSMKQNCETRWYSITLQGASVKSHKQPLIVTCARPDAQKKTNGLSAVAADVITIVLYTPEFWPLLDQLIKTTKPLVDAIGNLESRQATLADCMLELIRCARDITHLELDESDNVGFFMHAKAVFNKRFHNMNTSLHSLSLFLHPSCRQLAISQASGARSLEFMTKTALEVARKWRWPIAKAQLLVEDIKMYYSCKTPFSTSQRDGLDWWQNLPISADSHPLKSLAIILFSVVPHAAEVERLFSQLGGVQTVKRCRLTVKNFEALGKIRNNLAYYLDKQERDANGGKATHRKHAHMHTRGAPGINLDLSEDLEESFTWVAPLAAGAVGIEEVVEEPGTDGVAEVEAVFARFEAERAVEELEEVDGMEVLSGKMYDFAELARVEKGQTPKAFSETVNVVDEDAGEATWDVAQLMESHGISGIA